MDDLPRQKLTEIISRYGRDVANDPHRCEAFLKDFCPQPEHKWQINVLVYAIKEMVPAELLGSSSGLPVEVLLSRLTKRLEESLGCEEERARWAVETWAVTLGVAVPASPKRASAAGAMEMRTDQRPQTARDFTKALTGAGRTGPAKTGTNGTPGNADSGGNPYGSRIAQLVDELTKPLSLPPSACDARIADTNRKLSLCAAYHAPRPNHCPGCGNASLEEVTGRFTGNCPLCRAGKLMKRNLDPDKCPICRTGQLEKHQHERPLIFCPICRTMPLREDPRKRLGILPDMWWVCDHCKAELDLGTLKESAKLVRHEQDPFGIAAKYAGRSLPVSFWLSNSPKCNLTRKCSTCGAAFYEFSDASMMLSQCSTDPHGIAAQTLGKCVPHQTWLRLAYNLSPNVGNTCCAQCHAEFDFDQNGATLKLLSGNVEQLGWAAKLKGQALPLSTWFTLSAGKHSSRPGWLCKRCVTEFDSEETGLRLVQTNATAISCSVGSVLSLTDWQRLGAGVPTSAQEQTLQEELASLQASKQQEESAFSSRVEERRAELDAELAGLAKKSILGGFIPFDAGRERLPLDKGEAVRWNSPAQGLKQRSRQGQSYWDGGDRGTLFVTNRRVVFATPDAKRWQRPLSKMHTAQVQHVGLAGDPPVLVMGFDGLQKPVAFYFGKITANVTLGSYQCSVTLSVTDVADMLQSR
jgi:hypothetical protein